ncbi:VanZ family protein, partial [Adlercreutzia sp.]|uniref:VanZ family protein n=1 Tax=Adlercreutzia sp. TaxID=1872387 RepID=UPI003A91FE41
MGAVKHFLGNYSENFAAALVLWPALSFLLTLPILAYLYHRDGRLRFGTFVGAYLTVLYVCGLGCFTLYPLPQGDAGPGITYGVAPNFNPMNFKNDIAKDGLKAVFQLAFNGVFFMPLGFIAGRLLRLRFLPSVLLGLAASLLIEVSQLTGLFGIYPYAYRCCDADDVITNTLGAALGWVCAWLLGRV